MGIAMAGTRGTRGLRNGRKHRRSSYGQDFAEINVERERSCASNFGERIVKNTATVRTNWRGLEIRVIFLPSNFVAWNVTS